LLGEDRARFMTSREPDPLAYVREWRSRLLRGGWWHSFELPDGGLIQGVSELASQKMRIAQFPIPQDLTGKRVLDIGAWDGWFSLEMERRGAEVLAIDRFENPRFHEIRSLLGSRVEYRQLDVYEVSPRTVGYFDIVLFMGVLYHLKHPLLGLERVCSVTKEMAAVESFVLTSQHGLSPAQESDNLARFFEDDDFGGQVDNWFAPTAACLLALCRTAGFARAELSNRHQYGAAVSCFRTWGKEPGPDPDPHPGGAGASACQRPLAGDSSSAPELLAAVSPDNYGVNFRSAKDEYVTCRISAPGAELSRDSVFPEVGGYGVRPVFVGDVEDAGCLVHFRLPPGLAPGWHEVRLRIAGGPPSNALQIAVDIDSVPDHLEIKGACDGVSWEASRVSLASGFLSLWVEGLPENADIANVKVEIGQRRQFVNFVGAPDAKGVRQLNVRVERCGVGVREVVVGFGEVRSAGVGVEVVK
jgi:tRNA (mo5U34)-methyltransferase